MTRWAWILMIIGALLAPGSEAGAQGFNSPYNDARSKPPEAEGQTTPTQKMGGSALPTPAAPTSGIARTRGYSVGPQDVLEISVFGVKELSGEVEVGDSGNISLPLIGETRAAGKTAEQLQQDLTSKLAAEYMHNPQVRVTIKEFKSRSVTVSGHINKPGIYQLTGDTTLLQVVAMAGGFKDAADSTVLVLRHSDGKRSAARFDISAIEKGRAEDPFLQPGDTLVAGESAIKKTYQTFLKALPVVGAFTMF